MLANRYTALIDACALAGALTRNMILTLAEAGYFRPRWSVEILDETERAIAKIVADYGKPDPEGEAVRQRGRIERAFPEAIVTGHTPLIEALNLPDPKDRHVLAAAIQTRASVVVTDNLADLPTNYLSEFEITASSVDQFLSDVIDLYTPGTVAALRAMRERLKNPDQTPEVLLRRMESIGLTNTANILIAEIESL